MTSTHAQPTTPPDAGGRNTAATDDRAAVVDLDQVRDRSHTPDHTTPATNVPDTSTGQVADTSADTNRARPGNRSGHEPDTSTDTGTDTGADTGADVDAEDDEDRPVLVDSPEAQRRPSRLEVWQQAERRPVLPAWLLSRRELVRVARWVIGFTAHTTAFHVVRLPKYVGRLLARSPRGLWRAARGLVRWVFDLEGEPLRQALANKAAPTREDVEAYQRLVRQRDRRVRWRGTITAVAAVPTTVGLVAVWYAPWTWTLTLATGLTLVAGLAGRPADQPLLDTAVVKPRYRPVTSEEVVRALGSLGIGALNAAIAANGTRAFGWPAPIRQDGPGWRVDVELPGGVTAAEITERRDKLASALGRPLGCVWPEGNPEAHPGWLVLWVGQEPLAKMRKPAWPLLRSGAVDLFRPFPFGVDQRGRTVEVNLMFASMVIGAIPRMGKTFTLRLLLLAAALDPRAELHVYDLKGMGDFSPLEPVCHRYRAGSDEDDIAYALADMRELAAELNRRTKLVRSLPLDLCPEGKVTPELASDKRYRLHPIVVAVDECQRWWEHPVYGKELRSLCEDLVRRGPAAGIIPIFATQRPDANSLPTAISANAALRFCLKVMGQVENDMVLGTSAYKNGIRATQFSRKDLGIGYLVGEGDDPRVVWTFYLDAPAARRVVDRARAARERYGTLTGHALGEQPTPTTANQLDTLLEDILTVCPPTEGTGKFWTSVILDRLALHNPGRYSDLGRDELTAALRRAGIASQQVWGKPTDGGSPNRAGYDTRHIAEVVAERNRKKGGQAAA